MVDEGKVYFDERSTEFRGILIRINKLVVDVVCWDGIDNMRII
jgi:hypothetical protein